MDPSSRVDDGSVERVEMLIGVVPDLALRRRTCYEPLVSTHPDTQGILDLTGRLETLSQAKGRTHHDRNAQADELTG
ncbi:hypothetical protein ACTXJK_10945 [Brachybacterium tyrofermentans]|uniref:hypothetical protein n=1 Tax=Brachybacterium tyrofermentans TaxID=47848 RepID=UPI003FD4D847